MYWSDSVSERQETGVVDALCLEEYYFMLGQRMAVAGWDYDKRENERHHISFRYVPFHYIPFHEGLRCCRLALQAKKSSTPLYFCLSIYQYIHHPVLILQTKRSQVCFSSANNPL
jgi:hypothetical protein